MKRRIRGSVVCGGTGFKPTDNVVTAFSAYLGTNNTDHDSVTGQQILNTFAIGISGVASGITGCLADYFKPDAPDNKVRFVFLLVCPEHADTMYRDYPTKQSVKEYLIKKAAPPALELCAPPVYTSRRTSAPTPRTRPCPVLNVRNRFTLWSWEARENNRKSGHPLLQMEILYPCSYKSSLTNSRMRQGKVMPCPHSSATSAKQQAPRYNRSLSSTATNAAGRQPKTADGSSFCLRYA